MWSIIYTPEDLIANVQSYTSDTPLTHTVRFACLIANVGNILYAYALYNAAYLSRYFSYWALMLTAIFLSLGLIAKSAGYGVKALHHVLFEVTFIMNLVVVLVYWSTVH